MPRTLLSGLLLLVVAVGALGAAPQPASAACVITLPKAGIFVQAGTLYRNVPVSFSASGTPTKATGCLNQPSGTRIVKYEWDLNGDGGVDRTTTSGSASYTYPSIKQGWKAQVRVTDDIGNTSAFNFTLFNTVNKPPTASLSAPATALKNQPVTFSGAGSSDQTGDPTPHIKRYHWDIDGNASYTSSATTSKTFSTTGQKTIRLRVEDAESGFSNWVQQTVNVTNPPPVIASVSPSNASPMTGQTISFSASASAPAGGSLSYQWTLGDGRTSTSVSPSVAYSSPGTKAVSLTVRDQNGETATKTTSVSVQNRPPVAAFSCTPQSPFAGENVTCTSTSTDPDNGIASQWWDVDANGSADSYDTSVTFTSATPAAKTVRLTVTDGSSTSRHLDKSVTFAERKLLAAFTFAPAKPVAGQAVAFDASGSRDPGGAITKYEWDLDGNGSYETVTGTTPRATKTFANAGSVTVRLRVTSGAGSATTSAAVVVAAKPVTPPKPAPGGDAGQPKPAPAPSATPSGPAPVAQSGASAPRAVTPVAGGKRSTAASTTPRAVKKVKAGACASLKGKKRSACVKRQCAGLKGAKKASCVKKVSRKPARKAARKG